MTVNVINPENYYQQHFMDGEHHPWAAGYLGKIESRTDDPPLVTTNGAAYIVPIGATYSDWVGHDNELAIYKVHGVPTGTWYFITPEVGCRVWVKDEEVALFWDGSNWIADPAAYPESHVTGLQYEIVSLSSLQIQIGQCLSSDSTELIKLTSPLTINITTDLDTGSEAANTWYYIWIVRTASDGTIYAVFSTSSSAPTVTAGDKYRLIGVVRNNASSNFLIWDLMGDGRNRTLYWLEDIRSTLNIIAGGTATSFTTLSLATLVPPITREAIIFAWAQNQASALEQTGLAGVKVSQYIPANCAIDCQFTTDSAQQVDYINAAAGGSFYLSVRGFKFVV